ncbi:unnamed protein product [Linum trigynum]|uniref:Uncharacterized protein n=1 Tax=Linum trigynum TaxID=586398 RepID=A0AAV2F163_9ROSI
MMPNALSKWEETSLSFRPSEIARKTREMKPHTPTNQSFHPISWTSCNNNNKQAFQQKHIEYVCKKVSDLMKNYKPTFKDSKPKDCIKNITPPPTDRMTDKPSPAAATQTRKESTQESHTNSSDAPSRQSSSASLVHGEEFRIEWDDAQSTQRAEALESLLEICASLLRRERFEELEGVLKPFGEEAVSSRETAIWLTKSLMKVHKKRNGKT